MLLVAPSLSTGELSPAGTAALIVSSVLWALDSLYSTSLVSLSCANQRISIKQIAILTSNLTNLIRN
jgi:drug/metabolite transporter (DMT)-like permease